jgi:CheY-like chemotaxis protein
MATLKQIDANRRNAQKSTGPRTDAGRAAVRFNGLTHGLTAETLVLAGESQVDFESLLSSFEAEHEPATPTEVTLVSQLAMAAWRLRRGYHAEANFFTKRLADNKEYVERRYAQSDDGQRIAITFDLSAKDLDNFSRYEARLERSFHRALRELQRLRNQRFAEMKNQSQFPDPAEPDPPGPVPVTTPCDTESMPTVLAVVNDLFFSAKITDAAKRAGVKIEYVTKEQDLLEKAKSNPSLIIFDLNYDAAQPLQLIAKLKADDHLKQISLLGYLSHVQTDLHDAAQQTGCDLVMPRSAFSANLPQIMQRHAQIS